MMNQKAACFADQTAEKKDAAQHILERFLYIKYEKKTQLHLAEGRCFT